MKAFVNGTFLVGSFITGWFLVPMLGTVNHPLTIPVMLVAFVVAIVTWSKLGEY